MRKFVVPFAILALVSSGAVAGTKVVNGAEVRDWAAVDTNKDHLISPEEMSKHLEEQWAKNKATRK